jgi:hypothetical protein
MSRGPKQQNLKVLGGRSKEPVFQSSEYEVHQFGPKDSRSRNFSFLAHSCKISALQHIFIFFQGNFRKTQRISKNAINFILKLAKRVQEKFQLSSPTIPRRT